MAEKKLNNKCTLLISSCDNNEDLWNPFFIILKDQWPEMKYPVVLNTESKKYHNENFEISTFSMYKAGDNPPWGKRLKECLKRIDTDYVILILDDFFPIQPVDHKRVEECIRWMDENSKIAVFNFYRVKGGIKDGKYPHFELRPQKGAYKLNLSAALWKREKLIKYIRNHETPWQFEINGSKRAGRYKELFYSAIEGEPYIYKYSLLEYGLIRGKWTPKINELFDKYGIDVDYSIRGFADASNLYSIGKSYSIMAHFPKDIFTIEFRKQLGSRIRDKWDLLRSLI